MFLTRMPLNPSRRGTRHLLSSPQRMHAAVLAGFHPDAQGSEEGRVLWRLDQASSHDLALWVSSPTRPDFCGLQEQAGWPHFEDPWRTASLEPLFHRLEIGQRWAFRLTANPVINRRGDNRTSKRLGMSVPQQLEWLVNRSEANGFSLPTGTHGDLDTVVRQRRDVRFSRQRPTPMTVTLSTATFEGRLEVRDPSALRRALTQGIGKAKGYGCGLMTLANP